VTAAEGPLLDELRAALSVGMVALEAQAVAIRAALSGRLRAAKRRWLQRVADQISRRVVWQALVGDDEPKLCAQLEALAERVRVRRSL
jgi:hypothetical protein